MKVTGQCHCGAVTYRLVTEELPAIYACHCLDCQTTSGSAFGLHALLPAEAIEVEGLLSEYSYERAGYVSSQRRCSTCHTRIYNSTSAAPGMLVLRAGTLDNSAKIRPMAHIWTRRKQSWVTIPDHVPAWPESPTAQEFAEAMELSHTVRC